MCRVLTTSHIEKTDCKQQQLERRIIERDRTGGAQSPAKDASLQGFGHGESSGSLNPETEVHYSAEPKGLMFEMLPISDIENRRVVTSVPD